MSWIIILQDEKELCLATAQFEDFVLQFMDRYVQCAVPENIHTTPTEDDWKF